MQTRKLYVNHLFQNVLPKYIAGLDGENDAPAAANLGQELSGRTADIVNRSRLPPTRTGPQSPSVRAALNDNEFYEAARKQGQQRSGSQAAGRPRRWAMVLLPSLHPGYLLLCYFAGMRLPLKPHPESLCSAATHIDVDVARPDAGSLVLHYSVTGKIGDLRLPPVMSPARTDELWRHTCFEAFVGSSANAAYYEFNFAPSTQWAAYRFSSYRSGMRVATEISAPRIEVQSSPERYTVQASLELDWLSSLPCGARWRLGLSAVLEETSGHRSYWALAHPPGKADFHHSDCFAHEFFPA